MDKDITNQCIFGETDGECLPLLKCACGREFDEWGFILNMDKSMVTECDCGRKLYFSSKVTINEVVPKGSEQ
jgi:hypothetical protein